MDAGQEVRFASGNAGDGDAASGSPGARAGTPSGGGGRSRASSPTAVMAHKRLIDDIRISILREQMEQLESERARIIEESRQVKAENRERLQDQADIYYYLNKKLDSYYEIVNKLEEQIVKEQSERESAEKDYEKIIEKLHAKISSEELKSSSKIAELEDKLELSRKFDEQKPLLEAEISELKAQLQESQEYGKRTSDEWEKRLVQEKRRLRQELEAEMDALRASHAEDIERKLSLKTRKTKIANALYRKELLHQSKQAEDLTEKDRELQEQDRELRTQLALHRDIVKEMEKKLAAYRKTVQSLTEQLDLKIIPRPEDSEEFVELTEKYQHKCTEYEQLRQKYNELLGLFNSDVSKYGSLWSLVMQYYQTIKRGLRKPMNDVEITEDPDRFVMEVVLGAFEKHPARFRRAMRKHFSGQSLSLQQPGDADPETVSHENSFLEQISVFGAAADDSLVVGGAGRAGEDTAPAADSSKWWTTATMDFAARRSLSPPTEATRRKEVDMQMPSGAVNGAGARGRSSAVSSAVAATRSAPMLSLSQYQARIRDRKSKGISGLDWELLTPDPAVAPSKTSDAKKVVKPVKLPARSRDPIFKSNKRAIGKVGSERATPINFVPLSDEDFIENALECESLAHSVSTTFSRPPPTPDPSSLLQEELASFVLGPRTYSAASPTKSSNNSQVGEKSPTASAFEVSSSVFGEPSNLVTSSGMLTGTLGGGSSSIGIGNGYSLDRGFGLGATKTSTTGQGGVGAASSSSRLYHSVIGGSNLKSRRGGSSARRLKPIAARGKGAPGIQMEMSVAKISLTSPPKNKN